MTWMLFPERPILGDDILSDALWAFVSQKSMTSALLVPGHVLLYHAVPALIMGTCRSIAL